MSTTVREGIAAVATMARPARFVRRSVCVSAFLHLCRKGGEGGSRRGVALDVDGREREGETFGRVPREDQVCAAAERYGVAREVWSCLVVVGASVAGVAGGVRRDRV